MQRCEIRKKENGITLVALVVTIVVLLIIAGISIAMLTGENGIITKAQESKIETRIGDIKEGAEIIRGEYITSNIGEEPESRYIIEKLLEQGKIAEDEIVNYGDTTGIGILNIEGRKVEIIGNIKDVALKYEVINVEGETNKIRLYPIIKGSNT